MKACVILIEGTNCEDDAIQAFTRVGFDAEKVHLKQLLGDCVKEKKRKLSDYDVLFIPGGWSAGDYIRAGAIFAARLKSGLNDEITEFVESGKLVIGVCNGFQILVEAGILPGFDGICDHPEAILTINQDARFQCRPSYIKHVGSSQVTADIPLGKVMQIPVAHAEGRLSFGVNDDMMLEKLRKNGQIAFTYCHEDGSPADNVFPINPNGSLADIAGITNPKGNVLGMMPHPERVIEPWQMADWTRKGYDIGDGLCFFESIKSHVKK